MHHTWCASTETSDSYRIWALVQHMDKVCWRNNGPFFRCVINSLTQHGHCTEHLAASNATRLYCAVSYPLSDMASSHCFTANTLLPPQRWVLPCCIHDITPFLSHWDSAWHADNAHFLAPNIGKNRSEEPVSVFSLTVVPCIPTIIMDQRQLVLGTFFKLSFSKYSFFPLLFLWQYEYV